MSFKKLVVIGVLILAMCAGAVFLRLDMSNAHRSETGNVGPMDSGRINNSLRLPKIYGETAAERERIAKHNETLERWHREASAAAKKSFAEDSSPILTSITSTGELNPSVITSLSLSALEVNSINAVLSETRSNELQSFVARAELQTGAQDGSGLTYLVRAKRDRGLEERSEMTETVSQVIGDSRSKQLMSGVGEFEFYGGFGKYDVEVTFYAKNGIDMVKYQYLDPGSGKKTRYGEGRLDDPNQTEWSALYLLKQSIFR